MASPQEWSRFYTRPDVYGVEFIHANFVRHRFSRHVHDYYVFGFIEAGLQTFSYRHSKHATANGGIIILNPDEPHTGEPATPQGFTYKALYPSAELLHSIARDVTGRSVPLPFFTAPVIYDADISRQLLRLHRALVSPALTMAGEVNLLDVFAGLISRYADSRFPLAAPRSETTAIRRAREYIEAHYDQDISLAQLARAVSFSPYYLARSFTAEVGMPPHAYLESVRIRHARRLLALGLPIAEVALATGFANQSHFTNRFKRFMGVPPGEFVKQGKNTQDS
jgi:AraC-like DNA-binding protein